MGQYVNGHKICEGDVRAAFATYQALTGDTRARLRREGRHYWIEGAWGFETNQGAAAAHTAILCFCDGWQARERRAVKGSD